MSVILENAIGNSIPLGPVWVSTAETAKEPASTNKLNGLLKSATHNGSIVEYTIIVSILQMRCH